MNYLVILFVFNFFVIILLSNNDCLPIHIIFKKKIPKHLRLRNSEKVMNSIKINTYHSIDDKNKENDKNV